MIKVGKIVTSIPLRQLEGGIEGSKKSRRFIAYISLAVLSIPTLVIFPFFIQLKLFSLGIVFLGYIFFFNGNYQTDKKLETYEIQSIKE